MSEDTPGEMTFLEHLEELRRRLFRVLLGLLVGFVACLAIARPVYGWLVRPVLNVLPEGEKLAFTNLTDPFLLYMKVSFLTGIFVTAPYLVAQLWGFISPGLYKRERRYAVPFISLSSLFFIGGGFFAYYVVLPPACRFFIEQGLDWDFRPVITARELLSFESKILLGMGFVFQMPVLTFFLAKLGIVTTGLLVRNFKWAILIIFILAAVLTPTPDVVTQSLFAAPMIVLYLLSIVVTAIFGRKR